ncbi:MAG: TonB-dependent receptor plug domain-containing protein, partial [Longimicrobiales bacterium]
RLPGISTNDFTARLYVRGSRADEVLTLFDGIELFEPYHLKHWDAVFSILDVESVGNVGLITGGFPAEYGDRSAAVFSLESLEPPAEGTRSALGLSFTNASLNSQGAFDGGRGGWLLSARRGFLDIVFKLADVEGDFHPAYYDVFGKVQYELRPGHRLSARVLHAADDLRGADDDDFSSHADLYESTYGWITSENRIGESLVSRSILSVSRLYKNRHGQDFRDDVPEGGTRKILDVRDRLETRYLGFKTDLSWDLSDRALLKGGVDLRAGWAEYDYLRWRLEGTPNFIDPAGPAFYEWMDTLNVAVEPSGLETAAYLAGRFRASDALTAEVGLRARRSSRTGTGEISPRVSAAYRLSPSTTLRGAWGQYPQAPGLHELQVADGDSIFHPAQNAEHRILGIEHLLGTFASLRIEAFERRTTDPFPEYRNLVEDVEAVWEEGPGDRVMVWPERRRARGLEVSGKGRLGDRVAWSASYSLARAEDRVDGSWVPRPYDQQHTTHLHLSFHPTSTWTVTAVWQARSGWPASEQTYEIVELATGDPVTKNEFADLYGVRLPPYRRLDLRASKRFDLPRGGLFFYLDLFNALNRENPQNLDYQQLFFDPYRRLLQFEAEVESQIPRLVTLGLRWEF